MTEREQEIVAYLDDLTASTRHLAHVTEDVLITAGFDAQVEMLAAVRSFITEGAVRA